MKIISHNPYRIAGILSNISEEELKVQKSAIKKYSGIGKQIVTDYDFLFLDRIKRSEASIDNAFLRLVQNSDKVRNALFWFMNVHPVDATAISYLQNSDLESADELWKEVTDGEEIHSENFSCFYNLSTLYLLSKRTAYVKRGIEIKIQLLESTSFKDFVSAISNDTFTGDSHKQIEYFIDDLLSQLKESHSTRAIIDLFSEVSGRPKTYMLQQIPEGAVSNGDSEEESIQLKSKADKTIARKLLSRILPICKEDEGSDKNNKG